MKPGVKTSEFWLSTAAIVLANAQPLVEQTANHVWNGAISGLIAGIYAFSRAYTKAKAK